MSESTFINFEVVGVRIVGTITCEKIGAREAQVLETELRNAGARCAWKMALDLSAVYVMASMGLGMLVSMHKACKEHKGVLAVYGVRPEILDVLKITHLHKVLKIVDSRDEAIKVIK
ncbi:MAG: STAS domain-containing protein [Phycisphaeraceae bacterium]|nr:STAS domain-containing protein [Phycisphaeraceae bacterium]